MPSLKSRLIVNVFCWVLILLFFFGTVVYLMIRHALLAQFDASLGSLAGIVAGSTEVDQEGIELNSAIRQVPAFAGEDGLTYLQIWDSKGQVVAAWPPGKQMALDRISTRPNELAFAMIQEKDERPIRAAWLTFRPLAAEDDEQDNTKGIAVDHFTMLVAADATELLRQIAMVRWLLICAAGLTTGLSVFVAGHVANRGLAPINSMASQIAAIKEEDLGARIDDGAIPGELVPIATRLNQLLDRLQEAFERERRFSADVAHELRTPLAGIRTTIEVALQRTRESHEYRSALSASYQIVQAMEAMVHNLLLLARLEGKRIPLRKERIGLFGLIDSCWTQFEQRAAARQLEFKNLLPADLSVTADRQLLQMVVCNLLENATEYADQSGQICIAGRQLGQFVEMTISNTGCRLTSEQARHVFEPFWRADPARTATGSHCGLGLTIVERLMQAIGGSAHAEVRPDGLFTVRLVFGRALTEQEGFEPPSPEG
ncbi:MAG: histidine kinase dimerization/phospho-acceptor domain-containing protein [Sedimentisphaerales bacterium]|nr:histidine kinase dimerization/phospho-acceptor domain-containing protein [Sedimentisphaerales bacterium]